MDQFRRHLALGAICCCLLVCGRPGETNAQDELEDLQGIIPDYVPNGLAEDDFSELDGNWAQWAAETGRLVTDFYTSDDDKVRGRSSSLHEIQARLHTMEKALADPRYLPIYGPLADLHGRLSRRAAVANALLQTLQQDVTGPSASRVRGEMHKLADAERQLRSDLRQFNGGNLWVEYLRLNEIATATRGEVSADQLALIQSVQQKLRDRTEYTDEQQTFLNRDPVSQFAAALDRVADLYVIEDPDTRRGELRALATNFMEAIEAYSDEPTNETMQQLRGVYDSLRRLAPDGGAAVTAAMRKHYFNYNFRVVVDESLARDLVRESQADSGFINERVSQAHVSGCQWTNTTVNLDLKPSHDGVRFDLLLDGNVRSSITGSTHMATVYASGYYQFHGRKPVVFDGEHFTASPASVSVGGANRPYAAHTRLNWVPIVRHIARNAALREAGSAENNQYARNKVYREARSQFDRESDDKLHQAEQRLQADLTGPLRDGDYYPQVKQLRSTETEAIVRSRLMSAGEVGGGDVLSLPIRPANGLLVQLHESLLNQVATRFDLEGKRFTPEELDQYLKSEVEQIAGEPVDLGGISILQTEASDSPKVEEIIFHNSDAVRFQVNGGEVVLLLSLGLKLEGREGIEPQRISVPLKFSLAGDKIHMERGTVGVSPLSPVDPGDRTQQIARAGVMRQKIQEAFEPQDFDAARDLAFQDRTVRLLITDLRAHSGWLSVIATDGVSDSGTPQPTPQPIRQVSLRSPEKD